MAAIDPYGGGSGRWDAPPYNGETVTPSDTTDLGYVSRAIYVGVTGNVTIVTAGNKATITFVAVPAGAFLPIAASRVKATGTSATSIVAIW